MTITRSNIGKQIRSKGMSGKKLKFDKKGNVVKEGNYTRPIGKPMSADKKDGHSQPKGAPLEFDKKGDVKKKDSSRNYANGGTVTDVAYRAPEYTTGSHVNGKVKNTYAKGGKINCD